MQNNKINLNFTTLLFYDLRTNLKFYDSMFHALIILFETINI